MSNVYYIELECLDMTWLLSILYEKGPLDYYEALECYRQAREGGSFDHVEFYRCIEAKNNVQRSS